MGNWFCRAREMRVMIVGLDGVGKTTMLYNMKIGEIVSTIPTIGFNLETIKLDGMALTFWDVASRDKIRPLWRHYYANNHGIVFMIDSTDRMRLSEAVYELSSNVLASEDTTNSVVMVMANKQDLEGAMSAQEIEEELLKSCPSIISCIQTVIVVPCSGFDRNQVMEAFSYFVHFILLKEAGKVNHGLITLKDWQSQILEINKAESEPALKLILKNSVEYLKSFLQ